MTVEEIYDKIHSLEKYKLEEFLHNLYQSGYEDSVYGDYMDAEGAIEKLLNKIK